MKKTKAEKQPIAPALKPIGKNKTKREQHQKQTNKQTVKRLGTRAAKQSIKLISSWIITSRQTHEVT